MKLKLDEIGKISGQTIIIVGLLIVAGYFGYNWYQQHKAASGTGITWSVVLENGDEIPLNGTTHFYPSPLALYSDVARTHKIMGVKCHIWVTANSEASGLGNITLSGTFRQRAAYMTGKVYYDSDNVSLSNQTIPANQKTEITAWAASFGGQMFPTWPIGEYMIISTYNISGVSNIAGGSVSGSVTVQGQVTVSWTPDTLTIVPELSWETLSIS